VPVGAKERPRLLDVAPVGPGANHLAAYTQTEHEHRDDQRGGVDGVAEGVAECADPHHLVDEPADA
jgi:hypothetical protein